MSDQTQTTKGIRETWCPDAPRYDRGECGWPSCGCPDNGPTDAEVGLGKPQTTVVGAPKPKHEPWGRGTLCSGKLWVIEPDKECPICGAQGDEHCFKDPDYE